MRSVGAFGVVLAVACAASSCSGSSRDKAGGRHDAPPTVLTMANPFSVSDELDSFARQVALRSSGALEIRFVEPWEAPGHLDFETRLIKDVRAGKADLGWAGTRAWDGFGLLGFRALHAPLLIDSYALQERVLLSPIGADLTRSIDTLGLVGLGILPGPMRRPFARHALLGPSDYRGLTIGVQQSRLASEFFRTLGARPVWFAAPGDASPFGAIEQQIGAVQGSGYDAFDRYLTANVVLWPRPLVLFANRKRFDSLTATQREWLRGAAAAATTAETPIVKSLENLALSTLCRGRRLRIVEASPADLAAMRAAAARFEAVLGRDQTTRRIIARIEAIRAQHPRDVDPTPSCGAPKVAEKQRASTPIDGVYTLSFTPKELLAKGSPDALAENYGRFTFVFDRGWFELTQKSDRAQTWGAGTFTVHGKTLRMVNLGVGGIAPNGAAGQVGEAGVFRWSLYRGGLTLSGNPALNLEVKPWRRIADAPSRTFATPTSALDGTWVATWSAKQQVAADRAAVRRPNHLNVANDGRFVLVLRNGRFSLARDAERPTTGNTYRLLGDQIRFHTTEGQFWSYTWRIVKGRLLLNHPPGDHVRERWNLGITLSPWRRIQG